MKRILYPTFIPILYFLIGVLSAKLHIQPVDRILDHIDHILFGKSLTERLIKFHHPILTEVLYIVYLLFFLFVLMSILRYARSKSLEKSFYDGFFCVYWIGFFCYVLFPALGPYVTNDLLVKQPIIDGLLFSKPIYFLVRDENNHSDIFPSLHCAVSGYILVFDWLFNRRRFYIYLPLVGLIWLSTIYLGFHYAIDVLCGGILTLIGISFSLFSYRQSERNSSWSLKEISTPR